MLAVSVSRPLICSALACALALACDVDPGPEETADGESDGDTDIGDTGNADGPYAECPTTTDSFGFDEENPVGLTGADLIAEANKYQSGVLLYDDDTETTFSLSVSAPAETVEVTYTTDEPDGCYAYGYMTLEVLMTLTTADGTFAESFPALLTGDDSGQVSFALVDRLDAFALEGDFTPPPAFNLDDFVSVDLLLGGWFGPGQKIGISDFETIDNVSGTISGLGELKEWSCSDEPGAGCMGAYRDFFVGALRFDQE